jgi:hypothetical protein
VFAAGGDARERERRRDRATASGGGIARGKTESGSLERERLRETWRETDVTRFKFYVPQYEPLYAYC